MVFPDIALPSTQGGSLRLREEISKSAYSVLVFMSVQCPYALAYFPVLEELATQYQPNRVAFLLIDSNVSTPEDPEDLAAMKHLGVIRIPFLRDELGAVARRLAITHTPFVVVLDSGLREHYRGAIDERFKPPDEWSEGAGGPWPWDDELPEGSPVLLKSVLDGLLVSGESPISFVAPIGCLVKLPVPSSNDLP